MPRREMDYFISDDQLPKKLKNITIIYSKKKFNFVS